MSSAHLPSHVHGAARAVAEEDGHIPDEQVVWALRFIPRPCANASKITDHVWLGGASALADMGRMAEMNVKFVLTVMNGEDVSKSLPHGVRHLAFLKFDAEEEVLTDIFSASFAFIDEAVHSGQVCLVHCMAGMSRSATIVIAYLMSRNRWPLRRALVHVKQCRSIIYPNRGFLRQLYEYDRLLFGKYSVPEAMLATPPW